MGEWVYLTDKEQFRIWVDGANTVYQVCNDLGETIQLTPRGFDALARHAPEVKALVKAAGAAKCYMLDADLCDADEEWRRGDALRTALFPFQEASGV